ncbi:MAG: hypothetical protein ABI222_04220 [Opitutaceae bacterium]
MLKTFEPQRDLKSSQPTKQDFVAKLGPPKSSAVEGDFETLTWYYRRYSSVEELGEYVSFEARFDRAGVFTGTTDKHSGTLNLDAFLKKHLTPQERGVDEAPSPVPREPVPLAGSPMLSSPPVVIVPALAYQRITFEQFFVGQLAPLPLSLEIPERYRHADDFTGVTPQWLGSPRTYAVWMQPEDISVAVRSHHLPETKGFMHGRQTTRPLNSYNPANNRFQNEDQLDEFMVPRRMTLLEVKRFEIKGYPLFAYLARNQQGLMVGSLAVAVPQREIIVEIAYRPPASEDAAVVRATWDHILASLR